VTHERSTAINAGPAILRHGLTGAALLLLAGSALVPAMADPPHAPPGANTAPLTGNQPVTFLADTVNYDRVNGIVTAQGHVQAWQNDHYLSADRITFDRNTGVAAAHGHVLIVEPTGEIIFGDYAELSAGMKNGVITGMRALLAAGGKLAANGARRTEGKLNEMSRAVYSSCNVCALDPSRPTEWDIRADHMTQDLQAKRIEYSDAWLDFYGVPVFYFPYMSNTDPSVKRQSGFLTPSLGTSSEHLGPFITIPYYFVLDDQSDLLLTPEFNTEQGGELEATYRRKFNDGAVNIDGAIGHDQGTLGGYVLSSANFNWNDTWRYGANVNLGSSIDYLRDYMVPGYGGNYLGSNAFVEGFGVGSYTRIAVSGYQALNGNVTQDELPYVLPRYDFSFFSEPVVLGGRITLDTTDFDVLRGQGTDTQRVAARLQWDRSFGGALGEQWLLTAQVAGAAYHDEGLNNQPNYGNVSNSDAIHGQPQIAAKVSWPFVRDAGSLGTQIIEPIVQLIAAPQSGNSLNDRIPNEDSLDYEFTDSTLFSLNRFGGYDRFDGGLRANFALHGSWTFRGGQTLDALVGASAIQHIDTNLYPLFQPWNGFERGQHLSDVVGRVTFAPYKWVEFTTRARVDHDNGDLRFGEATMGLGRPILRLNMGYLYGATDPYALYASNLFVPTVPVNNTLNALGFFVPRNEVSAGLSTHFGRYTISGGARRDLETGQMDSAQGEFKYEDECTIFDFLAFRRYTSINGDHGNTTILFTLTLKTVGQFNFK
jgi:LPS-assembly protein